MPDVYSIPLTTRFRGITVREGLLLRGPAGWGEFCPFADYDDRGKLANTLAWTFSGVGGAAMVAGGVLYYLGMQRDESATEVSVAPTPGGAAPTGVAPTTSAQPLSEARRGDSRTGRD